MKIFYGVQGTGNGHITRARAMAQKLKEREVNVDWMFTGRPRESFFDMEVFGSYLWNEGLSFSVSQGRIQYINTAISNDLWTFMRDVRALDLKGYDLVITDFEPVTAWAAKVQGVKAVGISHQYSFNYNIPISGAGLLDLGILRYFAPVSVGLGVHWHHFDSPILPPIIEVQKLDYQKNPRKIIVYLPFEDLKTVIAILKEFKGFEFHIYGQVDSFDLEDKFENIKVRRLSRPEFSNDFADCEGVIANAGFMLASESLHAGKKLLVKPLHGQVEQLSNALALTRLGFAEVMNEFDARKIEIWLNQKSRTLIRFPDVAGAVADWLLHGSLTIKQSWIKDIWRQCERIV